MRTERFILAVLGPQRSENRSRKPSHRPANILPNARREVSNGLRCPRTEAVLLEEEESGSGNEETANRGGLWLLTSANPAQKAQ
jgi:hypothetical protein